MKKALFLIVAALMNFTGMFAVDFTVVNIEGNGPTKITPSKGINYFQVTANQTGTLLIDVGWYGVLFYPTDRAGSEDITTQLPVTVTGTGKVYTCSVEEGQTYFFRTSPIVDNLTLNFSYGEVDTSIQLSSNLSDGDVYSLGGTNLELTIDRHVNVASYTVTYTGSDGQPVEETIDASSISTSYTTSYYIQIDLYSVIDKLMDGGKISYGDTFTVKLTGIADVTDPGELYNEDGVYQVSLTLAEKPAELVSSNPTSGSELYTFYPENGEDGLVTLTFSDELNTSKDGVQVKVVYGNVEAGSYAEEYPDFTIEGTNVTVDLRGITFPETVGGGRGSSTAQQTQITLSVRGLTTADGRPVQTNQPNAGTSAVVVFYNIVKEEIVADIFWDPDQSHTLVFRQDKQITFYVSVPITYDGVMLTYWDARGGIQTRTLSTEDAPLVWDDMMMMYSITIPISTINFWNQGLIVQIVNAKLLNGDSMTYEVQYDGTYSTGIENITAGGADADTVVKVYGVDGTFVKEGAAGTVMQGLSKGLYIVNGAKVLVK